MRTRARGNAKGLSLESPAGVREDRLLAMTVVVSDRRDFTLDNARRVAFGRENARFSRAALARMARAHALFQVYVESNRETFIYGVTTLGGAEAKNQRTPEE